MSRKGKLISKIFFAGFSIIFGITIASDVYNLSAKTYIVDEAHLIRLATNHLWGSAEFYARSGKSSVPAIQFESIEGHKFVVPEAFRLSVTDKEELYELLSYNNTPVDVYTDKTGYHNYRSGSSERTKVYQLEINGKKYIDVGEGNIKGRRVLVKHLLSMAIFYIIAACLFLFIYSNPSLSKPNKARQAEQG